MKEESGVVYLMACCFALAGFSASFVNGLAQWLETGKLPPAIVWIVVIVAGVGGASTNLIAFFSQSYGKYRQEKQEKQKEDKHEDKVVGS